jgi:hypothetical protein
LSEQQNRLALQGIEFMESRVQNVAVATSIGQDILTEKNAESVGTFLVEHFPLSF